MGGTAGSERTMIGKFVTAAALSVGLVAGTAGTAFAATSGPGTSGSTPTAKCAKAAKVLTRLDKVEGHITTVLPKWEAAEQKATQNGHPKLAARIEKRIKRLERLQSQGNARIQKIEQRCPGLSSGASGSASVQPTASVTTL